MMRILIYVLILALFNLSTGCMTTKFDAQNEPFDEEYLYTELILKDGSRVIFNNDYGHYFPDERKISGTDINSQPVDIGQEIISSVKIKQAPVEEPTTLTLAVTGFVAAAFIYAFIASRFDEGRPVSK